MEPAVCQHAFHRPKTSPHGQRALDFGVQVFSPSRVPTIEGQQSPATPSKLGKATPRSGSLQLLQPLQEKLRQNTLTVPKTKDHYLFGDASSQASRIQLCALGLVCHLHFRCSRADLSVV